MGEGVFILVKDCYLATEQKQFKTNCEIIWVKINFVSAKSLLIAAYCRPKEADAESAKGLRRSLELVSKTKGNVWVLGDFNYPKFSLDADHIPTTKQGCGFPSLYDDFMTLISDFSFTQMVTEPTRLDNVLDLFMTSNYTLVQKVEIYPGIADHDVMVADVNIKPTLGRQEPRFVPLYRKANWDSFREYISVSYSY